MPEEELENNENTLNVVAVREITQTDHLNKKLLTSYLNNINASSDSEVRSTTDQNEEEEQNWDS